MSSLAIALAGCGGDDGEGATSSATSSTTGSTPPTAVADEAAQPTNTTTGGSSGGSSVTSPPATSSSTITLGWQPPTQNTDGTPITDLAGYKIHYGKSSASYDQTVTVSNAGLTRYVVDNLPSGTYYFAITAYNSKGMESPLSGEISTAVVD